MVLVTVRVAGCGRAVGGNIKQISVKRRFGAGHGVLVG
jgi:hypothetical protein